MRELLAGYLERCREAAPGFRWVPAENLHLTIRFLGNIQRTQLEALAGSLREITLEPFELRLSTLGTFGHGSSNRVVWLRPAVGADSLNRLAGEVEAYSGRLGLTPEDRPYHPHLTLARSRSRRGEPLPALPGPPDLPPWTVAGFQLYRSRLGRGGAAYSVIAGFGC